MRRLWRIVVVCDQALTNEAVRTALSSRGFEAVGLMTPDTATRARELAAQVAVFAPDAAVLMQEIDDPLHYRDAMATLRAASAERWLLLTGAADQARWGGGLEAGAVAVLPMSIGLDELAAALAAVISGEPVIGEEQHARLLGLWRQRGEEDRVLSERMDRLTRREMEILRALRAGRSSAAIAEAGSVSVETVRGQVKTILRKLEVSSQLAAVAAYQRLNDNAKTS